jgi:large subunit ribosomal protein L5
MSNFKKMYNEEIVKKLTKEYGYKTVMAVPKLEKIVINMGVGDGAKDDKILNAAANDLALIANQKPVITKARKSIAGFKLRAGQNVGVKVTLRGENMYNFLEKFIRIDLPSVRDFRGVSDRSFDGHGNYTIGIKEQLIFPEINYDDVVKVRGMDIIIVTTAKTNEEAKSLLKAFGMPFRN